MSFFKSLLSRRTASELPAQSIQRRTVQFVYDEQTPRHWYRGWPHVTRFFDGLSLMFPQGERLFIDSVVHFRGCLSPDTALGQQVQDFVYQEASHIREHQAYNQRLTNQGVPVADFERLLARRKNNTQRLSPVVQLALTASLEHLTAIISDQLLSNPRVLAEVDPGMADLWRWHALEETEHKAVAFDVLCAVESRPIRRYLLRCLAMLSVAVYFAYDVLYFVHALARSDRQTRNWREWLRLFGWLLVSPGIFMRTLPAWLFWFVPGFHPNRIDSRETLQAARRAFDARR